MAWLCSMPTIAMRYLPLVAAHRLILPKLLLLPVPMEAVLNPVLGSTSANRERCPLFAIPTTAGTGSEGTCIAVVSDNETHSKSAVIDNSLIPKAAALDPEVMLGLPASMTAATGMDALTHAIESYIGTFGNTETDFYGLASAKLVFKYLPTACSDGQNMEAREGMVIGVLLWWPCHYPGTGWLYPRYLPQSRCALRRRSRPGQCSGPCPMYWTC